jgi:hypothetical protein
MAKSKPKKKNVRTTKLGVRARDQKSLEPINNAAIADVRGRVDVAVILIGEAMAALGPLVEFDDEERRHSNGRLKNGEDVAVTSVLDAADAFPTLFVALASKDRGKDDTVFESEPTRDALARRIQIARLASALEPLAQGLSDTMLSLGEDVREVAVPVYAIARVAAAINPALRAKLKAATAFYTAISARGLKTKKNKKPAPPAGGAAS